MFGHSDNKEVGRLGDIDHQRFGNSYQRAFSPGLSSIGAAGFNGIRTIEGAMENNEQHGEERKMGNTFVSVDVNPELMGQQYPYSDDE